MVEGDNGAQFASGSSAFEGDANIAMGLVMAAWQWSEYAGDAMDWLFKMECEVNDVYDDDWHFPPVGDTQEK